MVNSGNPLMIIAKDCPIHNRKGKVDYQDVMKMQKMKDKGKTLRQIAVAFGFNSHNAVMWYLNNYKVKKKLETKDLLSDNTKLFLENQALKRDVRRLTIFMNKVKKLLPNG